MKKSFILFPLLFMGMCLSTAGQNIELPTEYIRNTLSGNNDIPPNVEGSPYFDKTFKGGTVHIADKSFKSLVRYNALEDLFEIKNEEGEVTSLLRRPDIIIELDGTTYKIHSYIADDGTKKQAYFKHLNKGPSFLLLKQDIVFKEAVKARNTYGKDSPASLKGSERYFLKKEDSSAEEIKLKRRHILNALDNDKVRAYVKENKMRLRDEAEVIRVLEYYDSINE